MYGYLVALLAGALLAFFFDPDRGTARRAVTRDRLGGLARHSARRADRPGRRLASDAYGVSQKVSHLGGESDLELDDTALAQKVMTELFRDQSVPKGSINVNAENGVVYLRGEVERPDLINDLVERTRRVNGVVDVENLLHLPGTPAPRS